MTYSRGPVRVNKVVLHIDVVQAHPGLSGHVGYTRGRVGLVLYTSPYFLNIKHARADSSNDKSTSCVVAWCRHILYIVSTNTMHFNVLKVSGDSLKAGGGGSVLP